MKKFLVLVGIAMLLNGCAQKQAANSDEFTIKRGLNASHWLSQTEMRGEERAAYMTEQDFKIIADMGLDHVRLPIDEMHIWDEEGTIQQDAVELMHNAIKWCLKYDLKVIVDLHVLRSHHFNDADNRELWEQTEAQEKFIGFWKQLSAELKQYPNNKLAYEPMNEAVSDNPEDWNKLINWVISELRKLEPNRTIVMGSNQWQQVQTFKDLRVPENDKHIILSFHFYTPFTLTHYKAPWNAYGRGYDGPINYPGQSIPEDVVAKLDKETAAEVKVHNGVYNLEKMEEMIMQAVVVAEEKGLPLYCGEFGCFPTTPLEMRVAWYNDMITIFNKHNIAWTHWNYKNDFPVVDENLQPIPEIVDALLEK